MRPLDCSRLWRIHCVSPCLILALTGLLLCIVAPGNSDWSLCWKEPNFSYSSPRYTNTLFCNQQTQPSSSQTIRVQHWKPRYNLTYFCIFSIFFSILFILVYFPYSIVNILLYIFKLSLVYRSVISNDHQQIFSLNEYFHEVALLSKGWFDSY